MLSAFALKALGSAHSIAPAAKIARYFDVGVLVRFAQVMDNNARSALRQSLNLFERHGALSGMSDLVDIAGKLLERVEPQSDHSVIIRPDA